MVCVCVFVCFLSFYSVWLYTESVTHHVSELRRNQANFLRHHEIAYWNWTKVIQETKGMVNIKCLFKENMKISVKCIFFWMILKDIGYLFVFLFLKETFLCFHSFLACLHTYIYIYIQLLCFYIYLQNLLTLQRVTHFKSKHLFCTFRKKSIVKIEWQKEWQKECL